MITYLSASKSLCNKRAKIIVSEERQTKHTANNVKNCAVRHYKIDGDVISDNQTRKCDFLVLNDDCKNAYFIELKGSLKEGGLDEAVDQVEASVSLLKGELTGYILHGRIVCKRVPGTKSAVEIKYDSKYRKREGTFKIGGHGKYCEDI